MTLNLLKVSLKFFAVFTFLFLVFIFVLKPEEKGKYEDLPANLVINDITQMNPISVRTIIQPITTTEIQYAIKSTSGPISIGGGRYSMGGQTAYEDSLHIDMRKFNKILHLDKEGKTITVQTGASWRDIQEYIDPYGLSVKIMQSYSNFTVGGSLSVNVHGRYVGEGPIINSVKSFKILLANGEEKTANKYHNKELFYSAIGGFGGIGVITEVTLNLTDNVKLERITNNVLTSEYLNYFKENIRSNNKVIMHNGVLYPPHYEDIVDVSYYKTDKELTISDKMIEREKEYFWGPKVIDFVAASNLGRLIRKNIIDPLIYSTDKVVWRNWEASLDVAELEPSSRVNNTYVLREYFVPINKFEPFIEDMKQVFNKNQVNVVNVSIRHAHAAPENYLSWARNEMFAFVVYYRQGTDELAIENVRNWSIEMIDVAIKYGGTYYLPYQVFASSEQFKLAYPNSSKFFAAKRLYDPEYRFRNKLWEKHYQ